MKALPLLLAASLAANAALLIGGWLRPSDGWPSLFSPTSATSGRTSTITLSGSPDGDATKASGTTLAAALKGGSPEELCAVLRAAGMDDSLVRQLVSARIWKNYEARFKALQNGNTPADPAVWWKNPEQNRNNTTTKEQREEMRRLQKLVQEENERILGKAAGANDNPWMKRQYGFLSSEKRELLQKTEQDYNELIGEINQETMGFQLPSDQEQLRFLQQEKRRDIEAMLTPEELRDYDLRNSSTANTLRWKMTLMNASEQEYVKIYDLQKDFDAIYNPQNGAPQPERGPDFWKQRQAAEKELNARIRATIGEDRYRDYVLGNDHGYQQLQAATRRFGLPEDTPKQVFTMREDVPASAALIADDPALTPDQKRANLAAIAEKTRDEIRSKLGAETADVILKSGSFNWINELEKGVIITYDIDGKQSTRRIADKPAK